MKKYDPKLIYLQEHWLSYHEVNQIATDFPQYRFHSTASDMFVSAEDLLLKSGTAWHGTTIGWKEDIDKQITKLPIVSERFCGIHYSSQQNNFLAYTLYLPTAGQDEEFLEILDQFSSDIKEHIQHSSAIFIGTDTNHSVKSSKRRKEAMGLFVESFHLKSILLSNIPTFHHNNQTSTSQIDHILYFVPDSSGLSINFFEQLCNQNDSDNLSAHDVILGAVQLPHQKTSETVKVDYSHTYEKFIVKKPNWEDSYVQNYQNLAHIALDDLFENFNSPEFIPALSEMCSKALVISAEKSFPTSNPKFNKKRQIPKFSHELVLAYKEHERICKEWRAGGRPRNNDHPLKQLKMLSQRNLQRIKRTELSNSAIKLHEELMASHANDLSKVSKKLKSFRGDFKEQTEIDIIETLSGTYEGENVLEGFCANTELLCNRQNQQTNDNHLYFQNCRNDNSIIFELSKDDLSEIPHMNLSNLKDIIFKRLKLNKACDIFKLTVEHLRYAGDQNLNYILRLLNMIIDHLNYLSSPQLNTAVATIVHKGKSNQSITINHTGKFV